MVKNIAIDSGVANRATGNTDVTGVLLAGGQSRRMGGGDKGLLELAGRPMLGHVICRLGAQVGAIVINANGDPARFDAFGLPVVPDTIGGFVGPLAGVLAGMRWSAANAPEARWIVTAAGDAPLLPSDLVARLLKAAVESRPGAIALAQSHGELHPVIGLWPVALARRPGGAAAGRRAQGAALDRPARHRARAVPAGARVRHRHRSVLQCQHAAGAGSAARHARQERDMTSAAPAGAAP